MSRKIIKYPQGFHSNAGIVRCDLLEQVAINFRIRDVRVEIGAASVGARFFKLVINPAEEDGFRGKLH